MENIRYLPGTVFPREGQTWEILERRNDTALVKQAVTPNSIRYCVIRIMKYPSDQELPSGKIIPKGAEHLPKTEQYGIHAWQFITLGVAREFYCGLSGAM